MVTAKHQVMVAACLIAPLLVLPAQPSIAAQHDVAGWRSDVDFVVEKIDSIHPKPWQRVAEGEFKRAAGDLKAEIPQLSEEAAAVRMMQLVASIGDGHTELLPLGRSEFATWFPVRLDHFHDGIFITAITEEHKDLLGAEVVRVGALAAEDAYARVGSAAASDSPHGWPKAVPPLFSNATILKVLGIVDSEELPLEVRTTDGTLRKIRIPSVAWRVDFGWTRWGFRAPGGVEFVNVFTHLAERKAELPLHLRHLGDTHFWFEHLPEDRALYVQFNSVSNSPEETLEQFTNRLWAFYEDNSGQIDRLVLDLRYNPGGNGYLLRPFIHEFIKHEEISRRGNLYAIIGPGTFSAASNCLAQLIEHTEVIVVGEPASGPLNWCSDTQLLRLPHTGMFLRVSTLCWQGGHASDTRGYFPPECPVLSLAPDLFAGRDAALEAILEGKTSPLTDILRNEGAQAFLAEYERRSAEFSDVDWWYPYLPIDLALLGFEMLSSDRPEDAIAAFRLNTTRYPDNWRTWDDLGDAYRVSGETELAIESYAKSWELNPENPYVQGHLEELRFLSAYEHGGIDGANRFLSEARNENPLAYSEDTINRIGYSVLSEGKKREAIDIFKLNTKAYPESWNAWDSLAEAYMENGDMEQAIKNYEKSLELNPANDNAREMLRRIRSKE